MKENTETNRKAFPVKETEHDSEAGKHQPDLEREVVDEKTTRAEASKIWTTHVAKEFNVEVKRAVDGAIYGIVGKDVLLRSVRTSKGTLRHNS